MTSHKLQGQESEQLQLLEGLFNHLVLPPRLPHREDPNLHEIESQALQFLSDSARDIRDLPGNGFASTMDAVYRSLRATKSVRLNKYIDRSALTMELNSLGENDFVVVHVASQNAALYIRRETDPVLGPSVIFEVFEASAKNEDVLATENALVWDFPGSAVAVSLARFLEDGFIHNLATFLEHASREVLKDFSTYTFKAGTTVYEYRNTPEPSLISSFLVALLQENGRRLVPTLLRKMVRDDVLWSNADKPWRRSPYWLALRVSVSRYLAQHLGGEIGRFEYKFLMANVLSRFIADFQSFGPDVERLDFLAKKLCRRLVKLEVDKNALRDSSSSSRVEFLFEQLEPKFNKSVNLATKFIDALWNQQKIVMSKSIPILPRRASPDDLRLDLRISGNHLLSILNGFRRPRLRDDRRNTISFGEASRNHLNRYFQSHYRVMNFEESLQEVEENEPIISPEQICISTSGKIIRYLDEALPLYAKIPELKSRMILQIMELWVKVDKVACALYPLMRDYHPVFQPHLLDVLLIPRFCDMARVNCIQLYLKQRIADSNHAKFNIFDDPDKECIGYRWYEQSTESSLFKRLHESIEEAACQTRLNKESEWKKKTLEYTKLSRSIDQSSCVYLQDDEKPLGRGVHDKNCPRCKMIKKQSSIRIQAYEHPLPEDAIVAKTVIFELACPPTYAIYRATTWQIIARLGCPKSIEGVVPRCSLKEYEQLRSSAQNVSNFSLASTTKPFLTTHYSWLSFPVEWENGRDGVCRPNGLRLGYYDQISKSWPGRLRCHPTFLHHVELRIPSSSSFSQLLLDPSLRDNIYGPSSYEIMATALECPHGVNVHEYLAFQTLTSGKARRWLSILTELSSSNLNFSSEAVMLLLGHLMVQCGPSGEDQDPFRLIHSAFRDEVFSLKLSEQLHQRLGSLVANWRETHLMEIIIVAALRIIEMASAANHHQALEKSYEVLDHARTTCARWFKLLRVETFKATDSENALHCQKYALWAALLCKRTFEAFITRPELWNAACLELFIQSSITIQDNLVIKLDSLPRQLQLAVTRDLRMTYSFREVLSDLIITQPKVFRSSLQEIWPEPENNPREFSHMELQNVHWVSCTSITSSFEEDTIQQVVYYNFIEGILLVDGQPMGKLPEDPKKSLMLNELFGEQALLTYPSDRPGMQYVLCVKPNGFQVHVGYDDRGQVIVRAFRSDPCGISYSLQLIPRETFRREDYWDLPGPLLENSFHWLHLGKGQLYITSIRQPWIGKRFTGYVLDVNKRVCGRVLKGTNFRDKVVDPYSPLFTRATRILDSFEYRCHILVTQPDGQRNLQVELPRLQILFYVNAKQLLQCPQLQCEIDPDQDAGTWFGLRSKLVCRNPDNSRDRSILVPLGRLQVQPHGCHIVVRVEPNGSYGKYTINHTLGRLDCAAEPLLIYMKALLHAYTSFLLPDSLTGKTGTEEAISWLQSGVCQPWAPLGPAAGEKLELIAKLVPLREYYPRDLKVMRTDHWRELPTTLQSSKLRPILNKILHTSETLRLFSPTDYTPPELPEIGELHLHTRFNARNQVYERYLLEADERQPPVNKRYQPRDTALSNTTRYRNVLEITQILRTWPQSLETTTELAQTLSHGNAVGGFRVIFDKPSLNDRINSNVSLNWGSLVQFACQERCLYSLMFLFGLISFKADADMSLIKALVAFAIFDELKTLTLPPWEEFDHFKPDQSPHLGLLLHLIEPFKSEKQEHDIEALEEFASMKLRKKFRNERSKFATKVDEDCHYFANLLLEQWPCLEPSTQGLSRSVLLDVGAALETIRPEWKRMYQNLDLTEHLREVQRILDRRFSTQSFEPPQSLKSETTFPIRERGSEVFDLRTLLRKPIVQELALMQDVKSNDSKLRSVEKSQSCSSPERDAAKRRAEFNKPPAITSISSITVRQSSQLHHQAYYELVSSTIMLEQIIERLSSSSSIVKKKYATDFRQSLAAFWKTRSSNTSFTSSLDSRKSEIATKELEVTEIVAKLHESLDAATTACSSRQIQWLKAGRLWPTVTKRTLLEHLSSTMGTKLFGSRMFETVLELAIKITQLQREIRLNDLAKKKEVGRYHDEFANQGHTNWDPADYPNWLLLEVESNMMIRPVQVDVAQATISPESGENSVLQMNMGQGKTSCIIPMVALALADKKQLVRVLVPKALLQQTAQLLQARLGGILGRQLRHVPFSRRTPTTEASIRAFYGLHLGMLQYGGIMLCQPEHNMSFMLSGRQKLLDNQLAQAGPMIKVHSWLARVSRDILDESDYTLAVRTQLIYPSGSQMTVDGHPHRWLVVEAILRLVNGHTSGLAHAFPYSIDVISRPGGGFPLIHFLRHDVEDELVRRVTIDICRGLGGILPMNTNALDLPDRVAIKDFISTAKPRHASIGRIRNLCPDRPSIQQTVYLLRGLLVNRILMMTLKKRWNVEYGLHPNRDPIAVPFHAKGVPSDQSEWGHPDVAILFTCLAFYYEGITIAQLRQCLEHILKSDDPSVEYDKWTQSTEAFPPSLRVWNSINVDDDIQLSEVWKAVRHSGVVVDYFLNNFVFPRHAKQFKVKLQSNGWDIPLAPLSTESSVVSTKGVGPMTTGFSGTNDNRSMLPLNIKQQDLPSLIHTSAEVLTYLLHTRNRTCVLSRELRRASGTERITEIDLLHGLKRHKIRVLIDAGAQILEMDNLTLASTWLNIDSSAMAALYFDEGNKPWVVTKQGRKTPLLASPYADDLSQCLVYLDEAHTRGTDLKLPVKCRGALTLRLGQTKDHTVQAAMRLRQLGTTQSVSFVLSPEVHQSIADLKNKTIHEATDSADVIEWLLHNTCDGIEQLQPLYYSQGMDYCRRMQAGLENPDFLADKTQRIRYIESIKQEEQQSLQQLYEPKPKSRLTGMKISSNADISGYIQELNSRKKVFQDTGRAVHASALQEVEQEREVAFEVESVRQVKKPHQYPAHSFPGLHPQLESFARTGRLPADAHYFTHILDSLARTFVGRKYRVLRTASDSKLFVTIEFDRTVKTNIDLTNDNFIRPVNWLLWSSVTETAAVIIPEEAEALIPILRHQVVAKTYLLTYAAPITRKMIHFNDFDSYSIPALPDGWEAPPWLRVELSLYGGGLYFSWDDYKPLCELLGIEDGELHESEIDPALMLDGATDTVLDEDENIYDADNKGCDKRLTRKPLTFVQEWLAVRRRGQDFTHSPMGFVSQGKSLQSDHAFFTATEETCVPENVVLAPLNHQTDGGCQDDYDDYHGVDDMGANEATDGDVGYQKIIYDASEYTQAGRSSDDDVVLG